MRKLILAVMLLVSLLAAATPAFQAKKPTQSRAATPKPTASPVRAKPTPTPARAAPGTTAEAANPLSFVSSVFAWQTLVFLLAAALVAFDISLSVGQVTLHDSAGDAAWRGLEAAILTILGGFLARMFVAFLLSKAHNLESGQIAVGWGFFLFPGAVDSFARLFTHHIVTSSGFFLWLAMIVGAFTGMMNGLWQIHDWKGVGWIAFPLDVTWGLAGATTGCLLHLIDAIATNHATETRYDAHRYEGGMRFKSTFALTQGPVMSNLTTAPDPNGGTHDSLYYHERTHVWQNRIFGPLFALTYLGWMVVWFIPAAIAAIVTKDGQAIEAWCYYNNPWETWAYLVGAGPRTGRHPLIWGNLAILLISIPFFIGIIGLFIWIAKQVWW